MVERSGIQGIPLSPYQISIHYNNSYSQNSSEGTSDWFGPQQPMAPIAPPEISGRQWDFQPGYNLSSSTRFNNTIGFPELRAFADGYDLLRLAIETRKDQVVRLKWSIKPRVAGAFDSAKLEQINRFFYRPDGHHTWDTWLRMILEDLFVIDAATIYMHRDRGGRLISLMPIDGATIKPVIDDWGRIPQPFYENGEIVYPVAYQQILKGLPAVDYTIRDLIYRPRNARTHRVYGYSPVEQIISTVNIALRRQAFILDYYTEGNIPASLIGVPETWTPDQIASYQRYWDAYFDGVEGRRRKAKFVPGGVAKTFIQTQEPELKNLFDEWLARLICFAFSLSPQMLVTQVNRATAETQKDLAEEEGLYPLLSWLKYFIDEIIEKEFDAPELEFSWGSDTKMDPAVRATILAEYISKGVMTINEARSELGLAPLAENAADRPMVLTTDGYVPLQIFGDTQSTREQNSNIDSTT